MSMWSISTRNSPVSSMQTTFGRRCKGEDHDGLFMWESMLSGVSWEGTVLFQRLLVVGVSIPLDYFMS
jgi:hypothetical protein